MDERQPGDGLGVDAWAGDVGQGWREDESRLLCRQSPPQSAEHVGIQIRPRGDGYGVGTAGVDRVHDRLDVGSGSHNRHVRVGRQGPTAATGHVGRDGTVPRQGILPQGGGEVVDRHRTSHDEDLGRASAVTSLRAEDLAHHPPCHQKTDHAGGKCEAHVAPGGVVAERVGEDGDQAEEP